MLQSMKFRILAATLIVAGLAACSSNPDKVTRNPLHPEEISQREQRLQAAALYAAARDSLDSADYDTAIQRYTTLATRFPFTDYAIQGELEKVYAESRAFTSDEALSDADHFLLASPRNPNPAQQPEQIPF